MEKMKVSESKKNKSKKAQTLSFNWIFVMIIGAVILLIAVIFSGNMLKTASYEQSAELIPAFELILNPFSAVGGLSKTIDIQNNAIIEFTCNSAEGTLGSQGIRAKTEGAFGKWSEFTTFDYAIYDKYIFADVLQGKRFYAFSKSLYLPFKIGEMIYITDKYYCFSGFPSSIESEIDDLGLENIKTSGCSEESRKVCLNSDICDITVKCNDIQCNTGFVEKEENNKTITNYFATTSLMYAAVFASYDSYNCNFARLMERTKKMAEIEKKKADALLARQCGIQDIVSSLSDLGMKASSAKSASAEKSALYASAEKLETANSAIDCPIF